MNVCIPQGFLESYGTPSGYCLLMKAQLCTLLLAKKKEHTLRPQLEKGSTYWVLPRYSTRDQIQRQTKLTCRCFENMDAMIAFFSEIQDSMATVLHLDAGLRHYCGQLLPQLDLLSPAYKPASLLWGGFWFPNQQGESWYSFLVFEFIYPLSTVLSCPQRCMLTYQLLDDINLVFLSDFLPTWSFASSEPLASGILLQNT